MAVYFEHSIQAPTTRGDLVHTDVEWHHKYSILAVASKSQRDDANGSVNLFTEGGEMLENCSIHRSVVVGCLQWHPDKKILAVGWASGEISTSNNHCNEIFEQSSIHRSPLAFVQWNCSGTRIVSGDLSGLIAVWVVDPSGQLHPVPLHQHRVQGSLSQCVLHIGTSKTRPGESVLESYSWQSRKTAQDFAACFCSTEDALYYLSNSGECMERIRMRSNIHSLLMSPDMSGIALLTHDMMLTIFSVSGNGQTSHKIKVKLSGKKKATQIIFITHGMLASCSNEEIVRIWDLRENDNCQLNIMNHIQTAPDEVVARIGYNIKRGVLSVGTTGGNVVMWRWTPTSPAGKPLEGLARWQFIAASSVSGSVIQMKWGLNRNLLAVNTSSTVQILIEHTMNSHFCDNVSAVQISPSEMIIENHVTGLVYPFKTELQIKGIFTSKEHTAVWSGSKVVVYAVSQDKPMVRTTGSFTSDTCIVALHEHNVYTAEKNCINVRTHQGTVKQVLPISDKEGNLISMNAFGHCLVIATDNEFVKMWDISKREAKLCCVKMVAESLPEGSKIILAKCNCSGTKIGIIFNQSQGERQELAILDVETHAIKVLDMAVLIREDEEEQQQQQPVPDWFFSLPDEVTEAAFMQQEELAADLVRREPLGLFWDPVDPMLLAVEAQVGSYRSYRENSRAIRSGKHADVGMVIASMYVTPDMHLLLNSITPLDPSFSDLLGISTLFLYFSRKTLFSSPESSSSAATNDTLVMMTGRVPMKEFAGLEQSSDPATLQAVREFSFYSMLGDMDRALKAIKLIKSQSVWESMARMCVKTQRMDIAAVCLGNMGNARAAKAVREAQSIPEPEARLAMLAVQLGMLEEAEKLFSKSKRFDLLNRFYQSSGKWDKALKVAEVKDRLHLKNTYYNYAKHAEGIGEIQAAISSYERSGTHPFEVPRMLFDDPIELESYVMKSKDKAVHKWWAEYVESVGDWDTAVQFYEAAKDYLSLVRILCFNGNVQKAIQVAEESGSRVAAYHLAKKLSMEGDAQDIRKAVHFFTKAQCYSPAIQLAKEYGLENELMGLALLGSPEDMMGAARFFEANVDTQEKAITLYHKAGEVSKALELCFQHKQYTILQQIAEDLTEESSPEMVERVAGYLLEHMQFEKAVDLLLKSKRFMEALDVCMTHNITITSEMADAMTLPKLENESPAYTQKRVEVLERLADCCLAQGSHHLATKKLAQIGNKTKVEIDEFQDYPKAYGALKESLSTLEKVKAKNPIALEAKISMMKKRIELVGRFVNAKRLYDENPDESMRLCHSLLDEPQLDNSVRIGDVYSVMIQHYAQSDDFNQAYSLMEEMRRRVPSVNLAYYLDIRTIEAIHRALGIPVGRGVGAEVMLQRTLQEEEEEEEESDESIGEEDD